MSNTENEERYVFKNVSSPEYFPTLRFNYRNHKGEFAERRVVPICWWFGTSPFHHNEQWFLKAYCLDRKNVRDFASTGIMEWL